MNSAFEVTVDGFTFDMGPTVITVPHYIEELFALERGEDRLDLPDFPPAVLDGGGTDRYRATARHAGIVRATRSYPFPITPAISTGRSKDRD